MKRRQRRPVLDISNEQSESPRGGRWQNKYQQIAVDHPEQNGGQDNPLASLLGQYNSDSETEETKQDTNKLNDKVNDFLKEIQMIVPDTIKSNDAGQTMDSKIVTQRISGSQPGQQSETSSCPWQECFDETTGYPYYWHIETNEVTWEMPTEMKILRDKGAQISQGPTQAHLPQVQVPWANFLPNTYPELQTNIPEGMIPKEVVARNRNRQVGLTKGHRNDLETTSQVRKKTGPRDDDSGDEKIEMITSFGNDESESEPSDVESPVKSSPICPPAIQKSQKSSTKLFTEKNPPPEDEDSLSFGPLLPPGIIPMIHGPENADPEARNALEDRKTLPKTKLTENDVTKGEEIDEEDILKRLKNQAKLLQSLGGEVPESVETLIKNDDQEDEGDEKTDEITKGEGEFSEKVKNLRTVNEDERKKLTKELRISLVAGYSDDSEPEEENSPRKLSAPLFPISEYVGKENSSSARSPGDSNPLGETLGVDSVADGGKSAKFSGEEEQTSEDDEIRKNENNNRADINGGNSNEAEEKKGSKTEAENSRQHSFFDNIEMPSKAFQRKKRIAFDVVPNKTTRPQPDAGSTQASKTDASTLSFCTSSSLDETEKRHGFGFHKEQQADSENIDSCGDGGAERQKSLDRDCNSQSKKSSMISFVKGETTGSKLEDREKLKKQGDFEKPAPDAESTKQLKELTEIVMEKIKFLSEGSQNLSAIQVMVIQLQTLIGAWEAGDLRESYLYEWLKGTGLELGRLEEAAAPPGYDCHWDRSHKRYYYRNSVNGEAQWTYPEADVVGGTEEMDLCTTPPPPEDEEPLIIEGEARKEEETPEAKSKEAKSSIAILGDNKIVQITKDEYKSIEAPPPPQISNPSPPPPPRIFAEDLKKGKKRRGSSNEPSLDTKKEKIDFASSEVKEPVDPPLPPSPPKNTAQPPLPPTPHAGLPPNPPSTEPLPPGVDPKDMPYSLPPTAMEPATVVYAAAPQQTNPIYAATIGDRGSIALPILDHRSALIQGQLLHYPTYHHLHNQAMLAAAGGLASQEAVQFMITDYAQVYANTQVIAKPPVKSQNEKSLGSALDSFYNDIASIEKTNAEQETRDSVSQDLDTPSLASGTDTPPPATNALVNSQAASTVLTEIEPLLNANASDNAAGKEKKRKKTKIGIGKKQKEMSTMVAKWQKAQQDFDDSE